MNAVCNITQKLNKRANGSDFVVTTNMQLTATTNVISDEMIEIIFCQKFHGDKIPQFGIFRLLISCYMLCSVVDITSNNEKNVQQHTN